MGYRPEMIELIIVIVISVVAVVALSLRIRNLSHLHLPHGSHVLRIANFLLGT